MNSYHPQETIAINKEIENEWNLGLNGLHSSHSGLFSGHLEAHLKTSHKNKLRWLITVWSLREAQTPDYFVTSHSVADPMTRY